MPYLNPELFPYVSDHWTNLLQSLLQTFLRNAEFRRPVENLIVLSGVDPIPVVLADLIFVIRHVRNPLTEKEAARIDVL